MNTHGTASPFARRGPGRPWQPGQSGNPNGRPRTVGIVRELAAKHTRTCVARLLQIVRSGRDESARAAAEVLLAYGHGRPPQAIIAAVAEFTAPDPAALRAALLARLAGLAAEPAALPPAADDAP